MEKQHPIVKYVERQGITRSDFAREVGVSPQRIHQIVTEAGVGPSKKLAQRIVKLTGGDISYADLFAWEPPKRRGKG